MANNWPSGKRSWRFERFTFNSRAVRLCVSQAESVPGAVKRCHSCPTKVEHIRVHPRPQTLAVEPSLCHMLYRQCSTFPAAAEDLFRSDGNSIASTLQQHCMKTWLYAIPSKSGLVQWPQILLLPMAEPSVRRSAAAQVKIASRPGSPVATGRSCRKGHGVGDGNHLGGELASPVG